MNWHLFASTFILVFLAEMGDKTQLTVLAQSANATSKWTIFAAGALALVTATAIGVLAGSVLQKFIPDQKIIRAAAGTLFLIFGILLVLDAVGCKKKTDCPQPNSWTSMGVVRHTEVLERSATEEYAKMAFVTLDPDKRAVWEQLAKEAQWHHEAMLCAIAGGAEKDIPFPPGAAIRLPPPSELLFDCSRAENSLARAIQNQRAMANYYKILSEHIDDRRLKDTFAGLCVAEENHARRLETFLK